MLRFAVFAIGPQPPVNRLNLLIERDTYSTCEECPENPAENSTNIYILDNCDAQCMLLLVYHTLNPSVLESRPKDCRARCWTLDFHLTGLENSLVNVRYKQTSTEQRMARSFQFVYGLVIKKFQGSSSLRWDSTDGKNFATPDTPVEEHIAIIVGLSAELSSWIAKVSSQIEVTSSVQC
ncbi:hypothetical protein T265_06578 [Opisthorchis viverrini]|uniref:Uncharacterized protein n=1 Tax=Opisthorchis viverrini TaxID=6198 RepID=A0A074ZFX2_OPIVI|nr:hypothetical protein T265_06578 [Opisthorchis viverrini]KER26098.1 hypothetical protein T265_06578 [Opisthorchis viverrini]